MNTGEMIKHLRKEQDVTQEDLANALCISAQSVSKWEKGMANPDITYIPLLAEYFHVSIETLFQEVDSDSDKQYEQGQNRTQELKKNEELDAIISLWENMFFRYPNDYRILKELICALCAKNDMGSFEKIFQYVILLLKKNENKVIENEVLDCLKAYMFNGKPVLLNQNDEDYLSQKGIDEIFVSVKKQSMKGKRVLLVDDAAFMKKIQKEFLTRRGFEIVGDAENGLEAVELYKELKPDIVIMDIVMPKLDGMTAAKQIKTISADACIIMCSALTKEPMVTEAKSLGVNYFIAKPFREEIFVDILDSLY